MSNKHNKKRQNYCGNFLSENVSVGAQYDSTHVYLRTVNDMNAFIKSFIATFGGNAAPRNTSTITPTPSTTIAQQVFTSVGFLSTFVYQTPIPYAFGTERTGYLVTDMDEAVQAVRNAGGEIIVDTFNDPIGRDTIIQWPGGLRMQLYWHTTSPSYVPLETVPDNRVYMSIDAVDQFIKSFLCFSHGKIISDDGYADGVEIGRPSEIFRRVYITSGFGNMLIFVTDGKLPYPFGLELTGYDVADLDKTLANAIAAGVKILVPPFSITNGRSTIVQFPGGYIAEIHDHNPNTSSIVRSSTTNFQLVSNPNNYIWLVLLVVIIICLIFVLSSRKFL